MYAMQYEITLPADYDMGIIRERVAKRGHLLDAFPGLGLKAYLIRERGIDNSPVKIDEEIQEVRYQVLHLSTPHFRDLP